MKKNGVFETVKNIFENFFDNEVTITIDSTMENTEEWESVSHIQLIFEIEEAFEIQFEAEEIVELDSIEKIIDRVMEKNN